MDQNKTAFVIQVKVLQADKVHAAYIVAERFTIGSLPNLPIVLKDPSVDRQHLLVSKIDRQIWLTDNHSACGTRVNGRPMVQGMPYQYAPGDRIQIGRSDCILQIHLMAPVEMIAPTVFVEPPDLQQRREQVETAIKQVSAEREAMAADFECQRREIVERAQAQANLLGTKIIKNAQAKARELVQTETEAIRREIIEESKKQIQEKMEMTAAARDRSESEALDRLNAADQKALLREREAAEEAQRIIGAARASVEEIKVQARVEAAAQANALMSEVAELRRKAEAEADRRLAAARQECDAMIGQSRSVSMAIERQAQENAAEVFRKAQEEAEARAAVLVEKAEARALAVALKENEKACAVREGATKEAERILLEAREQAARWLQNTRLKVAEERAQEVAEMMNKASAEAQSLKAAARVEAEKYLKTARQREIQTRLEAEKEMAVKIEDAYRKIVAELRVRQAGADKIVEAARASATEIVSRAHAEADALLKQGRTLNMQLHENARGETVRLLRDARSERDALIKLQVQKNGQVLGQTSSLEAVIEPTGFQVAPETSQEMGVRQLAAGLRIKWSGTSRRKKLFGVAGVAAFLLSALAWSRMSAELLDSPVSAPAVLIRNNEDRVSSSREPASLGRRSNQKRLESSNEMLPPAVGVGAGVGRDDDSAVSSSVSTSQLVPAELNLKVLDPASILSHEMTK